MKKGKYTVNGGKKLLTDFDKMMATEKGTVGKAEGSEGYISDDDLRQQKLDYLNRWMNEFVVLTPEEEVDYDNAKMNKEHYHRDIDIDRMEYTLKHMYANYTHEGTLCESLWGTLGLEDINDDSLSEEERKKARLDQLIDSVYDLASVISPKTNKFSKHDNQVLIYMDEEGKANPINVNFSSYSYISKNKVVITGDQLGKNIAANSKKVAEKINNGEYRFNESFTSAEKNEEYSRVREEEKAAKNKNVELISQPIKNYDFLNREELPDVISGKKFDQLLAINDNRLFMRTLTGKDSLKDCVRALDDMQFIEYDKKGKSQIVSLREKLGILNPANYRYDTAWENAMNMCVSGVKELIANAEAKPFQIVATKEKNVHIDDEFGDFTVLDVDVLNKDTASASREKISNKDLIAEENEANSSTINTASEQKTAKVKNKDKKVSFGIEIRN